MLKAKRELAKELLSRKNILIGYELEDGELEGNDKQVLIRPISTDNFKKLWNHGKKYCSKMTIYLLNDDLFIERRPDKLNYETQYDYMYNSDDLIKCSEEFVKKNIEAFEKGDLEYLDYENYARTMLEKRVNYILKTLKNVVEVNKELGEYNIIYKG